MAEPERTLIQKTECLWEIPPVGSMKVPGRIYATRNLIPRIEQDNAHNQVANVACLPGIVGCSLAMPDIHWGYGFPIGGVAAFDLEEGVISPGGVGYDINCGVRLMRTDLARKDLEPHLEKVVNRIFQRVPSGVGSKGNIKLKKRELSKALERGARWAAEQGHGDRDELSRIEENGCMAGADPEAVSDRAFERGGPQLGTLGSGNHFVEVGYVEEIYEPEIAETFGLQRDAITVVVHTGSRGFGHQVCDDTIKRFRKSRYAKEIPLPDPQLCCVPILSDEGKWYYAAMCAAVNFAFANRQIIAAYVRQALMDALGVGPRDLGMEIVYEVAHNIAKLEEHRVGSETRDVCVHRKGATRAFPGGHPALPAVYRDVGQPVLIPGDMGRWSYVLVGTQAAMEETFGSSCHGAGRVMSRHQAIKAMKGKNIRDEIARYGVLVKGESGRTLVEEIPEAYKDVSEVVEAVALAGIAKRVARLRPLGGIKG